MEVNTSLDLDYCLLNGDGELIPQYQYVAFCLFFLPSAMQPEKPKVQKKKKKKVTNKICEGANMGGTRGWFHQSCAGCSLQGTLLVCDCAGLGGSQPARIDLSELPILYSVLSMPPSHLLTRPDTFLANADGMLQCFNHLGNHIVA